VPDLRLMIPGPVDVDDEVLAAIAEPTLPHYGAKWMPLFEATTDLLKRLFETEGNVLMIPGPGSGALEAGIASLVPAGEGICIPENGFFGFRTIQIAEACGIHPWTLTFPAGEFIDPARLRAYLKETLPLANAEGHPIRAIALVHHETSTGILNPLREIAEVAHEFNLLLIVDAVASFGGVPIRVDAWGIDICISVPNKCLGAPPGVALMSVSKRAWETAENNPCAHGWYLDLRTWAWYRANWKDWHPYPTTLPTNNIVALHRALEGIFSKGVEAHFASFAKASQVTRNGLAEMGFSLFTNPAYAAPMISAINTRPDVNVSELQRFLLDEHNIMISGGLGDLHGKIFRIGHMGRAKDAGYTSQLLDAIRAFLKAKGLPLHLT
jgi:alanine-glyoxylate transaminase/serine-glyoxylate transaminase/serine-pyruvate transaminase